MLGGEPVRKVFLLFLWRLGVGWVVFVLIVFFWLMMKIARFICTISCTVSNGVRVLFRVGGGMLYYWTWGGVEAKVQQLKEHLLFRIKCTQSTTEMRGEAAEPLTGTITACGRLGNSSGRYKSLSRKHEESLF